MRSFFGSLRGRAAQAERPASPFIKMRRLLKVGFGRRRHNLWRSVRSSDACRPTYFKDGCSILGCAKDWVIIGLYIGSVLGGIPGAIIGITVGAASSNKTKSFAVGAAVGSIITILLFLMGAAGNGVVTAWAILSMAAGGLVGLITATCVGILRAPAEAKEIG